MIPNYKKLNTLEEFNNLVKYCESWKGHYFTYDCINGYALNMSQIEQLQNTLRQKGYTIRDTYNSHNVKSFWVL